jgi:hypothetical protein
VLAVDPLSSYIAELIITKENSDNERGKQTIYDGLMQAKTDLANSSLALSGDEQVDESGLPEEAYTATADFAMLAVDNLSKSAMLVITKLLIAVNELELDAETAAKDLEKIKKHAGLAGGAMVHILQVVRAATDCVDWSYVAERIISAGRERRGQ